MQKSITRRTGVTTLDGLWLSPLPLAQDCGVLGTTLPHHKTESVLSIVAGDWFSYEEFHKTIKGIVYITAGVQLVMLMVGFSRISFSSSSLEMFFFIFRYIAVPAVIFLIFYPFLLLARHRSRKDLPIFFHREKREVLFLRWNRKTGQTESLVTPWEEMLATTRHFYQINPYWVTRRANLVMGAEDPEHPGKWWCKRKKLCLHNAHSRMEWGLICRFMDADPAHFFPGEPGWDDFYEGAKKHWYPLPAMVEEWVKPIPKEKWARPSIRFSWYNAYVLAVYSHVEATSFLELGNIEGNIGYPGDEEAARQLEIELLIPVPASPGAEAFSPVLPGRQPPLPGEEERKRFL